MNTRSRRLPTEFWTFVALLAVYFLFFALCSMQGESAFQSFYNFKTMLTHTVIVGIGALGMTLVIISGNIDLSAGSAIALTTVVTALVLRTGGETVGIALPVVAVCAGILAAMLCNLVNGLLVSRAKLAPFIATLGMMLIARGLAKKFGASQTVVAPPTWLNSLMTVDPDFIGLDAFDFAPGVWLLLILLIAIHVVLRKTVFGRYVYAIGSNAATARLCGVKVALTTTLLYVVSGFFIGMAGIMQFSNLTVGDPTAASGMELDIIAAVVIGGGSLDGGEGSALGTVLGALLMSVLRNGCSMMGWENYTQNIIVGVVIIGAAGIDRLKHRRA